MGGRVVMENGNQTSRNAQVGVASGALKKTSIIGELP